MKSAAELIKNTKRLLENALESNHALNALQAYASMNDLDLKDNSVTNSENVQVYVHNEKLIVSLENIYLCIPIQNNLINTANTINRYVDMVFPFNTDFIDASHAVDRYRPNNKDVTFSAISNDQNVIEIEIQYKAEPQKDWIVISLDPHKPADNLNVTYGGSKLLHRCKSFKYAAESAMEYVTMNFNDDIPEHNYDDNDD